ncbi:hypothetical protein SBF1_370010 [Candidatus Desulfosporosinus infrequens]|uniref:Uncharacterized protein n=1 Tax=Candidatus Desulfosporosinus infrequens TaxID=2043169 RepID=A0A2U3L4A9_9FIRM|nr:hypothetical protein SBF1_370010 [Candidatus Desulfosporosinus infrequens]
MIKIIQSSIKETQRAVLNFKQRCQGLASDKVKLVIALSSR